MKTARILPFLAITLTILSATTYAQEASVEVAKVNSEISDVNKANLDELINHIESSQEVAPIAVAIANDTPVTATKALTEAGNTAIANQTKNNTEDGKKNKISIIEVLQLGASLASLLMSVYL